MSAAFAIRFPQMAMAGDRRQFEALLADAMRQMARGGRNGVIPEFATTFRAGFKFALITLGVINSSTTELSPRQMELLCERIFSILNIPPAPNDQF